MGDDFVRIGIPRALIYYYYYPLWQSLFKQLGIDTVISDNTTKQLVHQGTKISVPEICLPIKIFNGHVANLLSKEVDYVFVPRFVRIKSGEWFCPKFIGLPELVKYTMPEAQDKFLTVDIEGKREDTCEYQNYRELCDVLDISPKALKQALKRASSEWKVFRGYNKEGFTIDEAHQICYEGKQKQDFDCTREPELTLGLLGYVYNIYDSFISMDVIKKLRSMGIKVVTFEMMQEQEITHRFGDKAKTLYWTFTDKIYGTAATLMQKDSIDGFIHVTAFGCGPDSIVGKLVDLDSDRYKKPFMTLRVDEHTGESHLLTRIEAFVDMIKRKKNSK